MGGANGDGNGRLNEDADQPHDLSRESLKLFEHLSKAKLVPETYTSVFALDRGYPSLKLDSTKGMISGGYIRESSDPQYHQLSSTDAKQKHIAVLYLNVNGTSIGSANDLIGVTNSKTLAAIDAKFDDGVARSGRFKGYQAFNSSQGPCLTGIDGDYLLTNDLTACMAEYILAK